MYSLSVGLGYVIYENAIVLLHGFSIEYMYCQLQSLGLGYTFRKSKNAKVFLSHFSPTGLLSATLCGKKTRKIEPRMGQIFTYWRPLPEVSPDKDFRREVETSITKYVILVV